MLGEVSLGRLLTSSSVCDTLRMYRISHDVRLCTTVQQMVSILLYNTDVAVG